MVTNLPLWDGAPLSGGGFSLVVFAAEQAPAATPPAPVLAGVSDGRSSLVLRPEQLGPFLRLHAGAHLACHDAAELHSALRHHLDRAGDAEGVRALWGFARQCRLHDVALLDQQVRLAEDGTAHPERLPLDGLARRHLGVSLRDDGALGAALRTVTPQLPAGANPDLVDELLRRADAVFQIARDLWGRATSLPSGASAPAGCGQFGPLALGLQVRGAIALADATRGGLRLAAQGTQRVAAGLASAQNKNERILRGDPEARQCFRMNSGGQFRYSKKSGLPAVRRGPLLSWLGRLLLSVEGLHRTALNAPLGSGGRLSDVPEDWGVLLRCNPLLRAWADLLGGAELARFCTGGGGVVRPRYEALPTLRSRGPDLEALRRLCGRGLFEPPPGHAFLVIELPGLELRALAAVCQRATGKSTLAAVLARGGDPEAHTAAALAGLSEEDFAALRSSDPGQHERWLTVARALLWAAPQGLAGESVHQIARTEFGLTDLGLADLQRLQRRLQEQALPELSQYLRDDTLEVMASNLGTTAAIVEDHLRTYFRELPSLVQLRQWFLGSRRSSEPVEVRLRALLERVNARPPTQPALEKRPFGPELYVDLFGQDVVTLTGRVLGRLLFGEARREAYLTLADDAAKAALFALAEGGYRVVAFAEGTAVLEVDGHGSLEGAAKEAEGLARGGAEEVLGPIPVACVGRALRSW
jgi:hypothetical protein